MFEEMKARAAYRRHDGELDSGDVVQVVVLVAGFVIIAIVLIVWLGTAAMNKGADTAECVEADLSNGDKSGKINIRPGGGGFGVQDPGAVNCVETPYGRGRGQHFESNGGVGTGSAFKENESYKNRYAQPRPTCGGRFLPPCA